MTTATKLSVERHFTREGEDPYSTVEWELRDAKVGSGFEQKNVEFPTFWSQTATNIVAQKYFRGRIGTPEREWSLKQLIGRVVGQITKWGIEFGYFDEATARVFSDELTYISLHQYAAFNSPVQFNIGAEGRTQTPSACFILDLQDNMESIKEWIATEADIFRAGSGSGVNVSRLREDGAPLSRGGTSSGPLSFMRWADSGAGAIKSGGSSRRAAKLVAMDIDHPDIEEFIECKAREERKIRALRAAGFEVDFDGKDTHTLGFQNANNSVRVSDEFLHAVENDENWNLISRWDGRVTKTVKARELMRKIAEAAWACADPGLQFDTTINKWNTTPSMGRLEASNPCLFGSSLISTNQGQITFRMLLEAFQRGEDILVWTQGPDGVTLSRPSSVVVTGVKEIISLEFSNHAPTLQCTPDHKILTNNRGWIEAWNLRHDDQIVTLQDLDGKWHQEIAYVTGRVRDGRKEVTYDLTEPKNHSFIANGVVVHNCAEHIRRNGSSCNLASINLMKFLREDGEFNISSFRQVVRVVYTAMDIMISGGEFPTEKITEVTHQDRDLGLGYCNLGALLMAQGLPYDSDEGRAWAAGITSLMTGLAYERSTELAEALGPHPTFEAEAGTGIMHMHARAAGEIDNMDDRFLHEIINKAQETWRNISERTEQVGLRNAQASVIAPTGCLVGDSLIATERGLVRLDTLGDPLGEQWQRLGIEVATDDGPQQATQFFVNGIDQVVSIETNRGYRIQGTPSHRVKVVDNDGGFVWRRLADVRQSDKIPLVLNGLVGKSQKIKLPPLGKLHGNCDPCTRVPLDVTPDLAEFIGYFMGDGSLHSKGLRLCVPDGDADVITRLTESTKNLFGLDAGFSNEEGYISVNINSVPLVRWWKTCGFSKTLPCLGHRGKGWVPHIPDAILRTNDHEVYTAFVRGLFEADGTTNLGYISWSTTSQKFSRDIQTLMLALGFITTRKIDNATSNFGSHERYVLRLLHASASGKFLSDIRFISSRKAMTLENYSYPQAPRYDHIPVTIEKLNLICPFGKLRKSAQMAIHRSNGMSRRSATSLLEQTEDIELEYLLGFFYDSVDTIEVLEDQPTYDLSVPSNVTYIANGFVSHNTISFMMDATTTGMEPEFALVKLKKLVGGGTISTTNPMVGRGLKALGYKEIDIAEILAYVNEHSTVVNAPGLDPAHYPVFATSMGDNSIAAMGHVKMMAAIQPGLSGAQSKTVNLPSTATVDDVYETYMEAWRLGIKCIALYVEGSKVAEPMTATKKTPEAVQVASTPTRRRLPRKRPSDTTSFRIKDPTGSVACEGYMNAGRHPDDGKLGEIFVKVSKQGSTLAGVMDAFAIAVSLGLQYGVPLDVFVSKFVNMRFEPSGGVDDPDFLGVTSIMDYLFRALARDYLSLDDRQKLNVLTIPDRKALGSDMVQVGGNGHEKVEEIKTASAGSVDAPLCYSCGVKMQRAGTCYVCDSCGSTSGCS